MKDSCILWEGKSSIDDSPIICILTGLLKNSSNPKTGGLIQSWIIQKDILPLDAAKQGTDTGVCGNCPLKPTNSNICYVNLLGVNNIWRKYVKGGYQPITQEQIEVIKALKVGLRMGSYGDPAAMPIAAWQNFITATNARSVGYTHQWRDCDQQYSSLLMASVSSFDQVLEAQSMGWRTFRIFSPENPGLIPNEIICLNKQSPQIQCKDCNLCNGANGDIKPNIAIPVHGLKWKIDNFRKSEKICQVVP